MKYCINGRHSYATLSKADEIYVKWPDKDKINDFVERLTNKTIILELPYLVDYEKDLELWKQYYEVFNDFIIAPLDLRVVEQLVQQGIKWYWPYPITSFYELREVAAAGPCYIKLGPPLSFDLAAVKEIVGDIPLRMVVNSAIPQYLYYNAFQSGVKGQWVRPEGVSAYEPYITAFEFEGSLNEERATMEIYQSGSWPGNLNLLINRLNFDVDNRALPEDIDERRLNCGQKCASTGNCHLCGNSFMFAKNIKKLHNEKKEG